MNNSVFPLRTASCKKPTKVKELGSRDKEPGTNSPVASTSKEKISEEQSKKVATSLILFEEVDVIFDDDAGFLAAIKTFMTTTKRPVILTTSGESEDGPVLACYGHINESKSSLVCIVDPAFRDMFDGHFEEVHFKAPSLVSY